MLDHVSLPVTDLARSRAFYEKALAPLGYKVLMDFGVTVGFGVDRPDFWLSALESPGAVHLAFRAADRGVVAAFHAAALEAGAKDNGAPGLREYHDTYYGAFALDPDGHNVEAVCHEPE